MDIIFATNNNFCQHAAVAIASLLAHNAEENITIHLFEIQCEKINLLRIEKVVQDFAGEIIVYHITPDIFQGFPPTGNYSIACYLRLLSSSLLPNLNKVLYLDCDLVINGSIRDLWDLDIEGYSMAALYDTTLSYNIVKDYIGYDYDREGYVNSGVLLMNLKYWREKGVQKKLVDFLNTHTVKLPDQDALNIILHGTIKILDPKWNCHVGYFAFPPLVINEQKKYIKKLWRNAVIIHFTGPAKPWCLECVNPYRKIYLDYLKLTPWKNYKLCRIEKNYFKSYKKIFLRHLKNVVAYVVSNCYR